MTTTTPKAPNLDWETTSRVLSEDRLFQPTQWYPRIAKYDDLRGWDLNQYLGPSEFYNNFGRFDVRIDVPAGWIVSGTGVLQNPQEVLTSTARERLGRVLSPRGLMPGRSSYSPTCRCPAAPSWCASARHSSESH